MLFRTTSAMLTYLNDPGQLRNGRPEHSAVVCCGLNSAGYRIGNLALVQHRQVDINGNHFGDPKLHRMHRPVRRWIHRQQLDDGERQSGQPARLCFDDDSTLPKLLLRSMQQLILGANVSWHSRRIPPASLRWYGIVPAGCPIK